MVVVFRGCACVMQPSGENASGLHSLEMIMEAELERRNSTMAEHIEGIKAGVFDAYGTLFDFNSAVARCHAELGDRAEPLSNIWREKQLQYTWLRSLMGRHKDFWQVTGDALDFAMETTVGVQSRPLRDKLLESYRQLDAFPDG